MSDVVLLCDVFLSKTFHCTNSVELNLIWGFKLQKIIRYLTKEKFEWLLADKGIYIGPASKQNDCDEGVYDHRGVYDFLKETELADVVDFEKLDALEHGLMHNTRDNSYLSSWYFGSDEKQLMWDQYAPDGVLIVSSTFSLTMLLPDPLGHATSFANVIYDDAAKATASNEPLNYKNLKWQEENEFRLIFDVQKYSILTGYQKERFPQVSSGGAPSYEDSGIISGISKEGLAQKLDVISPQRARACFEIRPR